MWRLNHFSLLRWYLPYWARRKSSVKELSPGLSSTKKWPNALFPKEMNYLILDHQILMQKTRPAIMSLYDLKIRMQLFTYPILIQNEKVNDGEKFEA